MSEAALRASERGVLTLTERQAAVYQLVAVAGLSIAEAGRKLGVSKQAVHQVMVIVRAKMEAAGEDPRLEIAEENRGTTSPEARAFWEAGRLIGLDQAHIQTLLQRHQGQVPDAGDVAALDERGLTALVEEKLALSLRYLDASTMARSTSSQLAKVAGTLMTMRQLLKGEATSIVRLEDRRKLGDLAKALTQELDRRKIIDVTPEVIEAAADA